MSTASIVDCAAEGQSYREDYREESLHLVTTLHKSSQDQFIRSGMNRLTNLN